MREQKSDRRAQLEKITASKSFSRSMRRDQGGNSKRCPTGSYHITSVGGRESMNFGLLIESSGEGRWLGALRQIMCPTKRGTKKTAKKTKQGLTISTRKNRSSGTGERHH